jgi:hypothetical protein
VELVCLENMIFSSEQESQSRKNSSHGIDRRSEEIGDVAKDLTNIKHLNLLSLKILASPSS